MHQSNSKFTKRILNRHSDPFGCITRCVRNLRWECFGQSRKIITELLVQGQWELFVMIASKILVQIQLMLCVASWQNQQNELCTQRRLRSAQADAQADLSLRRAHMPFCWFCHEAALMCRFRIPSIPAKGYTVNNVITSLMLTSHFNLPEPICLSDLSASELKACTDDATSFLKLVIYEVFPKVRGLLSKLSFLLSDSHNMMKSPQRFCVKPWIYSYD